MLAQSVGTQAPPPAGQILNAPTDPRLQGFRWRSVGPTGQGGRIDDLAVNEQDPSTFYIGYAVSGLWKTTNNGTTYEHLTGLANHSVGDVALAPSNPDIIYVGSGEPNNRQSSSFGDGMYKSTDMGRTWKHIGLDDTRQIAAVRVHPTNPEVVYVAAQGPLWRSGGDRHLGSAGPGWRLGQPAHQPLRPQLGLGHLRLLQGSRAVQG